MGEWTEMDPGAGDMGCVSDAMRVLDTPKQDVADLAKALDACVSVDVWAGQAGDAWRVAVQEPKADLARIGTSIQAAVTALGAYVESVGDIARRATSYVHNYVEGQRQLTVAQQVVWANPFASVAAQQTVEGLELSVSAAQSALEGLAQERRTADAAVCRALDEACGARWKATRAALRSAGITSVDQLDPDVLAQAFVPIAQRIANGKRVDGKDAEALRGFLEAFGDDQQVMNRFVWDVGGKDYANVIDRVGKATQSGEVDPVVALALAQAMRHGLSVGSADWLPKYAKQYAADMLRGANNTDGGRLSAVGYLFGDSDNNPVGQNLTIAMANAMDEQERDPGMGNGRPWVDISPLAGGRILSVLEGEKSGVDGRRVNDLPGRVLQTLGKYPDAALKWLNDPGKDFPGGGITKGRGRIDYWFGERAWGIDTTGDGWEAPAALWAGAQNATGGPLDAQIYNENVWQRTAETTGRIINSMGKSGHFDPSGLSELGKVRLAGAIAADIPQLTEYPVTKLAREGGLPFQHTEFPGADGDRYLPNPDRDALAKLVGAAATSTSGSALITNAVHDAQNHLVQMAASGKGGLSGDRALDSVVALQGFLDGSTDGAKLDVAHAHDVGVQAGVSLAVSVVDAVPVFGTGIRAADWSVSLARSTGETAAGGLITDWCHWADDYKNELASQAAGAGQRENAITATVERYSGRLPGVDDPDSYFGQYDNAYDAFRDRAEGRHE